MVNGTISAGLTNTALNSFLQSPARESNQMPKGQINNYQKFIGLSKGPKVEPSKVK